MTITVIHGPMATGKTYHSARLREALRCRRVFDDWTAPRGRKKQRLCSAHNPQDGDLVLTNEPADRILKHLPDAILIPIETARDRIGVGPVKPLEHWHREAAQRAASQGGASDPRIKTAIGPTILLQSGAYFDLLDPHGSDFTIEDIAHGLAHTCRFAGQCLTFYSVAEHCYHASFLVPPQDAIDALLHDAAEAFIGDVTRPLKSLLPEYKAIERRIEVAIGDRFGLLMPNSPASSKHADRQMLAVEQAQIMPAHADSWAVLEGIEVPAIRLHLWKPDEAKRMFMRRFNELWWGNGE